MKIAFIGTYPPRECGIGTFTNNLFNSVVIKNKKAVPSNDGFIVALNDFTNIYDYPEEVKLTIRQERLRQYLLIIVVRIFAYSNMSLVFLVDKTGYIYCPYCIGWKYLY